MVRAMADEEVAARIVEVYFKEIARLGYKRKLSLDEVINSYYYALARLSRKEQVSKELMKKIVEEEKEIRTETKEELIPQPNGKN